MNGVFLALVLCALFASPARAAVPALGTDGDRIVDAAGREVLLRGLNVDGLSAAPVLAPVAPGTLRALGFNAVRLQLTWSKIEPGPGAYDDKHLDNVERVIDALAAAGVYTVLAVQPQGLVPGLPVVGARTPRQYAVAMRRVARRLAVQPGLAGFDLGDSSADLAASVIPEIRAGERDGGAAAAHLVFLGRPFIAAPGERALVYAPRVATADGLSGIRAAAAGFPVSVSEWAPTPDAARFQDALNGLRLGGFVSSRGVIDPRGPLARAYVRAAPGTLEFSHYEEPRGHFAARGKAPAGNAAPVQIFYPQGKHAGARFRARGLANLRAIRGPGGSRMVYGVPTGRWSFQIGPQLTR